MLYTYAIYVYCIIIGKPLFLKAPILVLMHIFGLIRNFTLKNSL